MWAPSSSTAHANEKIGSLKVTGKKEKCPKKNNIMHHRKKRQLRQCKTRSHRGVRCFFLPSVVHASSPLSFSHFTLCLQAIITRELKKILLTFFFMTVWMGGFFPSYFLSRFVGLLFFFSLSPRTSACPHAQD